MTCVVATTLQALYDLCGGHYTAGTSCQVWWPLHCRHCMTCVVATTLHALHHLCGGHYTLQALHDLCGGHYTAGTA